ncbi:hypothetical protein PHLGIDRAFT_78450 [Phlebiopsis gigantea 11061_1 CR5-6]|uniref:Uncharacterized protein n=1 Tax=Phlebiopsis gigantea (strain 11061_1 CR5-6) TaxID=745531 RepID=A0A0C3NE50_PHLG1|nr:hypothetical protein PHLGIDRAFT_78450 [Phlebiopsis gigantea 11061_1 CR5-6]
MGARLSVFYYACIQCGVHPNGFEASTTVVLPKPNQPDYSAPKAYRLIALFNCLGKLFEKCTAQEMQFNA